MEVSRSASRADTARPGGYGPGGYGQSSRTGSTLEEADCTDLDRRDMRKEVAMLKEFSHVLGGQLQESQRQHQIAIDQQHSTYLDIVRDMETCLKATEAERDALRRRAEAAEAKLELLAQKMAASIRRKHDEETAEMQALLERVAAEKSALVTSVAGLAADFGVDASVIVRPSSPLTAQRTGVALSSATFSDVTALVDCIRARHVAAAIDGKDHASRLAAAVAQLGEQLTMATMMVNRRINNEDLLTGAPKPFQRHSRRRSEGWEDRGLSTSPVSSETDDDENVFEALRLVLTDSLVHSRRVGAHCATILERAERGGAMAILSDATQLQQGAIARLSQQLELQLSRHARYRVASRAMLDAAEAEYVRLVKRESSEGHVDAGAVLNRWVESVKSAAAEATSEPRRRTEVQSSLDTKPRSDERVRHGRVLSPPAS